MTDAAGNTVTATTFDAWGNPTQQTASGTSTVPWQVPSYNPLTTGQAALLNNDAQSIGFTGYQKDSATGLYYAGARFYDPLIGGFNGMDPWSGDNSRPITLNKYLYANGNPTFYIDPSGLAGEALNVYDDESEIPEGTNYYAMERGGRVRYYNADSSAWSSEMDYAGLMGRVEASNLERQTKSFSLMDWARQEFFGAEKPPTLIAVENESGPGTDAEMAEYQRTFREPLHRGLDGVRSGARIAEETACSLHPVCAGQEAVSGRDQAGNKLSPTERVLAAAPGVLSAAKIAKLSKGVDALSGPEVANVSRARASISEGTGTYYDVGGHHVHAKAALRGHASYDPKRGFSLSQEFMRSRGWRHERMTVTQQRLFKELGNSGGPNTLAEHTRIAVESLKAGGATEAEARVLVSQSLRDLRVQGVRAPTRIPWYDKDK